jgi:hypothetical protein
MMSFALSTSAGRPVADQQDFFRLAVGFVLRNAVFDNLHGGQDDDTTTYRRWDSSSLASDGTSSSAQ